MKRRLPSLKELGKGFPRSDVQFKKPGDKVTVLNMWVKKSEKRLYVS